MRMLVSVEFADAGSKSGTHGVLIIGRDLDHMAAGDIGLTLEEAKTLINAIESEFVSAQAAEIVEARRQCGCGKHLVIKDWKLPSSDSYDIWSGLPAESARDELHM